MASYFGNIELDDTWRKVGSLGSLEGVEWLAFIRDEPNCYGWNMVKVSCDGYAEAKANYWLTWNGERIAKSREMAVMCKHRPELAKRLVKLLGGEHLDLSEHKFDPMLSSRTRKQAQKS